MEKIIGSKHSIDNFLLAISRLFERAGYYGIRSMLVLYMISETIKMPKVEAIKLFGSLSIFYLVAYIIGAFVGDFIIGNKRSAILGGLLQTIGAFLFCVPNSYGLFAGIILIIIGGGLYSPNFLAQFGNLYRGKPKLLDSGFSMLTIASNLGAFAGVLLVGTFTDWNIRYGFIATGFLMVLSTVFVILSKEKVRINEINVSTTVNTKILIITVAVIVTTLFWEIYNLASGKLYEVNFNLINFENTINLQGASIIVTSVLSIIIAIIAVIFWTYFYSHQLVKLSIGFLLTSLAFRLIYLIPTSATEQYIPYYLFALVLLSVAEIFIAPIIYSLLTMHIKGKYLASAIALSFIPSKILAVILVNFKSELSKFTPNIGILITILMSICTLLVFLISKRKKPEILE